MLFSAASFARHVPTAIAAPSVARTRTAAPTKNCVARPGPRAPLPAGAGLAGETNVDSSATRAARVA